MSWVSTWQAIVGLPKDLPAWAVASVALVLIYGFVILPSAVLMSFLERKLSADLQARVGPNRAGPAGFFQPFADLFKLLQKRPIQKPSWRQDLWFVVYAMGLYSTVAVLPLGSSVLLVDTDMSAFIPFWAALVLSFGTMLLGLNQPGIPGWFGGIRVAAQALAGSFPALICMLAAAVVTSGFRWSTIVQHQTALPGGWTVFSNPFEVVAFIVFVTSGLVLMGVSPLDGALSISDLKGGVAQGLYGTRLSLFRVGRFYGFFLWTMIAVILFLGGWNIPADFAHQLREQEAWRILQILELSVLLIKTFLLMLVVIWVARSNARLRVDQITDLSWKVLSPLSLFALMGAAIWVNFWSK